MLEVILAVLLNVSSAIVFKADAMTIAYTEACTSIGGEYHAFDEHEPYTYHCFIPKS